MLKQAFRSYLSALHPRNIKKLKESPNWFSTIYFLCIYPMLMSIINDDDFARFIWFAMIKLLPFWLMIWSNVTSKFLMPKAMFLCPMKQEERKEYINCVLLIKIGIPVLFGIALELIWSIFDGFHLWQIIEIAFVHFSIGIATYICFEEAGRNDQQIPYVKKDKKGKTKRAWMNIVSLVLGLLFLAGVRVEDLTSGITFQNGIHLDGVLVAIFLVLFLIFDIRILATQYECTIENACNYEQTFRVLGKVPTNDNVEFDIFKK